MEDINALMKATEESMSSSVEHLQFELTKIRTGKASTNLLTDIAVNYYGSMTPVNQVASLSTADARTIVIQPWERNMVGPIERVIINSNLGITPQNDGECIRLSVPPLTEERRKELVKKAKHVGEESKVGIRNSRHKALEHLKKAVKDGLPEDIGKRKEADLQNLVKKYVEQTDSVVGHKEKEIMTV